MKKSKRTEPATAQAPTGAEPKANKKAPVAPRRAQGAPAKGKASKKATAPKKAPKGAHKATPAPAGQRKATRDGSKSALILGLLKRPGGATTQELMNATDWQPHSVRGFLSGTVRKKLGLNVISAKGDDGDRSYSIEA